jgi:hypothetical protein
MVTPAPTFTPNIDPGLVTYDIRDNACEIVTFLTATDPTLKVNFNPITSTLEVIRFAAKTRTIFLSLLGISWFWLVGALILAQLPAFARDVLGGDKTVYTLLLAAFP